MCSYLLQASVSDEWWLILCFTFTQRRIKEGDLNGINAVMFSKFKIPCSGLQRGRRWDAVGRPDDGVHQQQTERPEAQWNPLPASSSRTDKHSDREVSAWQGTAESRYTHTQLFLFIVWFTRLLFYFIFLQSKRVPLYVCMCQKYSSNPHTESKLLK